MISPIVLTKVKIICMSDINHVFWAPYELTSNETYKVIGDI